MKKSKSIAQTILCREDQMRCLTCGKSIRHAIKKGRKTHLCQQCRNKTNKAEQVFAKKQHKDTIIDKANRIL